MKSSCLKAVIFDLGNVVIKIDFNRMFPHWSEASGMNISDLKSRFSFDETYNKFEKNEISPDTYRAYALDMMGIKISPDEFDRGFSDIYVEIVPGIEDILKKLLTETRIVALTNTNKIHALKWKAQFASILNYFEKIFCSHELQARKPESKAYLKALDYLVLNPKQVLFIDDNNENVQGAKMVGIQGLHVKSLKELVDGLISNGLCQISIK